MFCPQCGQEQISEQTRFCSRCGFLLTGVTELIATGGATLSHLQTLTNSSDAPRKKGLKQGLMFFLLTFLVVPIVAILSASLGIEPFVVAITAVLFFVGGILRMIYALLFESGQAGVNTLEQNVLNSAQNLLGKNKNINALPPQQTMPASTYAPPMQGNWRDTADLAHPSVTEGTTKLLEKEE